MMQVPTVLPTRLVRDFITFVIASVMAPMYPPASITPPNAHTHIMSHTVLSIPAIPLVLAGWLRYLKAVDDEGKEMACSSDPMLAQMQADLADVKVGEPESVKGKLQGILSNPVIFGVNLYEAGLADKVEVLLAEMLAGPGAVRATLKKYLG